MLFLWILPSFVKIKALDVWIVPIMGALILYSLPKDLNENILTIDDFQTKLPWNIIFLILGGTAMSGFSEEFGIINWLQGMIPQNYLSHCGIFYGCRIHSNFK